jgi:hypothetical protein
MEVSQQSQQMSEPGGETLLRPADPIDVNSLLNTGRIFR